MAIKRNLILCAATLLVLVLSTQTRADNLRLTLDLRNTSRLNPLNGGTWQLFARKVETGAGAQGDFGVSSLRALLNNISATGITIAPGISQPNGVPFANTLTNGVVEIDYAQDLNGTVITGVGVNAIANRDQLIASGSWPAGPRPTFGVDPGGLSSEGHFLTSSAPPYGEISPDDVLTEVVTLGDFNGSATITNSDIALFVARFPGAMPPLPYSPAADFNQNGTITSLDIAPFIAGLTAPLTAATTAVPEPASVSLLLVGGLALMGRRRS